MIPPGMRWSGSPPVGSPMVVALANFVPHTPQEADRIMELGTCHLLAWTDDSFSEEEGEQMQEEGDEPKEDERKEVEGWGESNPKAPPGDEMLRWGEAEPEIVGVGIHNG